MKKIKKLYIFFITAIVIFTFGALLLAQGGNKAYAQTTPTTSFQRDVNYSFTILQYDVDYTINVDRTMQIEEVTKIKFMGRKNTGHMHLIPINAGDRVRNLEVYEVIGGVDSPVEYTLTEEYDGFIGADIGDYTNKYNQEHTYKLKYEYAITKPVNKNAIYISPIGFGWDCTIENADITLRLPEGFKQDGSVYYIGNTTEGLPVTAVDNVINLSVSNLEQTKGVTFDLYFNDGVLGVRQDLTPYYFLIIGGVLLTAIVVIKLLKFNQAKPTPVTNVSAPDNLDPLEMGKLIDNKVDQSDVTSLIYYWANKGNLKIDLSDEDDIRLIRITPQLPPSAPNHQKLMFDKLFDDEDEVKINDINESFYNTVQSVTKEVNRKHGDLYTKKSVGFAIFFAVIGALLMGLAPVIYGKIVISLKLTNYLSVIATLPAIAIFILVQQVQYMRYKKKKNYILSWCGIVALSAFFILIYTIIVPSHIVEVIPKILISAFSYAIVILSATFITRSKAYTQTLNQILGFKDFIESVEKDRLETMISDNPELYYNVLPYAQVLGVSDIWEDKFKSINIQPPQWAINSTRPDLFDIIIFNRLMRSFNANMHRNMVAHTASRIAKISGGLSGGGGGHFGGGGGFGHGGGGGFSR